MKNEYIQGIIENQREYYKSGKTKALDFRLEQLRKLKAAIEKNEALILDALKNDFNKPSMEGYTTEIGISIAEIDYMLKKLRAFARPKKVSTPPVYFGGRSFIMPEALGVVLVIGPWNYPFQLVISPLIGAMAAGNCAVLKPSELSPHVSAVLAKLIRETFEEGYIAVVEGGIEQSTILLEQEFEHIFFTGGASVGKIIMGAAAKHLTPVTLELGGKSPCIVDTDINLEQTARRIVWGKFLNAGQTCVAPDYLMVHKDIKESLMIEMKKVIREFYGDDAAKSNHYARIINERHFDRLSVLLTEGSIVTGGHIQKEECYIEPTIIEGIGPESPIMRDEIFGPILPVLEYKTLDEVTAFVESRPKPLALYFFSRDKAKQQKILRETSSGGVCINDTISHITTKKLPFGGVGPSGMGCYHGKASFDVFSHHKSVLRNAFLFDIKVKYPPYKISIEKMKKLMKFI